MKNIILIITLSMSVAANAQITKVYLQASGLTCSMCSNSINKALRTLDFVDKIDADIKNYTFEISFKADREVDFDKIKKKVEDAGFSVSGFFATIYFNEVNDNQPIRIGGSTLFVVDPKGRALNGEVKVKVLDKGFITSKEYKSNSFSTSLTGAGIYHVTI